MRLTDRPRDIGKALKGLSRSPGIRGHDGPEYARLGEYLKSRGGSHRLICNIDDATRTVLVLQIGDRKEVYR